MSQINIIKIPILMSIGKSEYSIVKRIFIFIIIFNSDINQFAGLVLQEICSQDWIKERCLKEGENLLKPVHLLESALLKPQTLLRIICYPENHHLRNINDQITSTKDVIRNILQNLDIWTLRESLLELKLMIETQKSKDCHYVSFI
jgi:mediator of RNA polymerase II transcription subunit 12